MAKDSYSKRLILLPSKGVSRYSQELNQAICTSKTCLLAQALESDPINLQQVLEREKILQSQYQVEFVSLL